MPKGKLTEADNKFISKFFNRNNDLDFNAARTFTRANRFTGETVEVDPICASAIDFIFRVEDAINSRSEAALRRISPELKMTNAVSNFDRARMLVLKLNADAYMTILD